MTAERGGLQKHPPFALITREGRVGGRSPLLHFDIQRPLSLASPW